MIYREAKTEDIPQMQRVRNAVKENALSDPDLVKDSDYEDYLLRRGKGWLCEINGIIAGFAIADLQEENIWALFVRPGHEKKGIGKALHKLMLDWYFGSGKTHVWLSTAPATRAAHFYQLQGWRHTGNHGKNEIKFEMTASEWITRQQN
jgi:GNAT superfamily N-acetyltransferase